MRRIRGAGQGFPRFTPLTKVGGTAPPHFGGALHQMGGGPRVVVSTAAFQAKVWCSVPGLGSLREAKMFLPHPRVLVSIVGSLRDQEAGARPQTARARISNPVSGGQCHLNHLTILRRFSWPSLAYMCTKVA